MAKRRTVRKTPSKGRIIEYVVEGATIKCSAGTKTIKLKTPGRKKTYIQGKLKANILDYKPFTNLSPFGKCKRKKMKPCIPLTMMPWVHGKEDLIADKAPALQITSKNKCILGGTITIVNSGQMRVVPEPPDDYDRKIYQKWLDMWVTAGNNATKYEQDLRKKLHDRDPIDFADKMSLFNAGKTDAFGPEYEDAVANRDAINDVISTAPEIQNWIENQVAAGHYPTLEEINDKVPDILKGYKVKEFISAVFFAVAGVAQAKAGESRTRAARTRGSGKSTTSASRLVSDEAAAAVETEIEASARTRPRNIGRGRTYKVKSGKLGVGNKGTSSTAQQLEEIANKANQTVPGQGTVPGTLKHSEFAKQVKGLNNPLLQAEVTYKNGQLVPYGTKGGVRLDVVEYNVDGTIKAVYDLKTGKAGLTTSRIQEILNHLPNNAPVYEIRPK